ncbi:hypothetical protein [Halomicrobium salinisoli]|nr:hypothetical protein [Halomicrobium salinisoli]
MSNDTLTLSKYEELAEDADFSSLSEEQRAALNEQIKQLQINSE